VNLSEFILPAVLRSAALCIWLRNISRKWWPATSQHFVQIFCNGSEAILSLITALFPGGQTFILEKHLKEFANHIDLVRMI